MNKVCTNTVTFCQSTSLSSSLYDFLDFNIFSGDAAS